jgi:hypothetical protein
MIILLYGSEKISIWNTSGANKADAVNAVEAARNQN